MATITTRSGKGSPLTNNEVDSNFTNLNTDKVEKSGDSITGNLSFADNAKAVFGAGSDLQIYHSGTHSYLTDVGTGNLYLRGTNLILSSAAGESYADFTNNGAARLYYDGSVKLATTSSGIEVTGIGVFATPSGGDSQINIETSTNVGRSLVYFKDPDGIGGSVYYSHGGNFMAFETNGTNEKMRITSNGRR